MFGIGFSELVLILLVVLIAFGPEKLPELARTLGRLTGELRRNSDALKREFYSAVYAPSKEATNALTDLKRDLNAVRMITRPSLVGTCEENKQQEPGAPSSVTSSPDTATSDALPAADSNPASTSKSDPEKT